MLLQANISVRMKRDKLEIHSSVNRVQDDPSCKLMSFDEKFYKQL